MLSCLVPSSRFGQEDNIINQSMPASPAFSMQCKFRKILIIFKHWPKQNLFLNFLITCFLFISWTFSSSYIYFFNILINQICFGFKIQLGWQYQSTVRFAEISSSWCSNYCAPILNFLVFTLSDLWGRPYLRIFLEISRLRTEL